MFSSKYDINLMISWHLLLFCRTHQLLYHFYLQKHHCSVVNIRLNKTNNNIYINELWVSNSWGLEFVCLQLTSELVLAARLCLLMDWILLKEDDATLNQTQHRCKQVNMHRVYSWWAQGLIKCLLVIQVVFNHISGEINIKLILIDITECKQSSLF